MLAGAVRQLPSAASASASPNLARYADRSCRKLALGNLAAFVIIGVWTQRDPAGGRESGHRLDVPFEQCAVEYQLRGRQMLRSIGRAAVMSFVSDRECGGGLDLAQSDGGVDLLDARQLRELVEKEPLVSLDVPGHDPQHEIDRAHQHIALEHFGQALDSRRKFVEIGPSVSVEFHLREDMGVQANLGSIDERHARFNNSVAFQPIDPPIAWRLRQTHLLGDRGDAQAGVLLQNPQDHALVPIKLG